MISLKKISLVGLLFIISLHITSAQNTKKTATCEFKVHGNCEMCKMRIESSLNAPGVKTAQWDMSTKMLRVVYKPDKIEEKKIREMVATSGHDTKDYKTADSTYQELPLCCQYQRIEE